MAKTDWNETDRQNSRAYARDFAPALIGYCIAVIAATMLADLETAGWRRYLLVLVPLIPAAWGVRAVARHLGRIDEYQRNVHLEAMALGFAVAMMSAITIGFLSIGGLETERWGSWLIYAAGMAAWAARATQHGVLR